MWQSCFADGTRGLTAAARCTRLQPASGEHAARLRLKRSFSAPHISYCMGQYSCLHTPSQAGLLSVFTVRVPRLPVLSAPVYVFTVEGLRFRHSASQSPSRCSAATVFPVRVPRAALSSSLCMYGPRHSDSVTARVRVRHGLGCSAATFLLGNYYYNYFNYYSYYYYYNYYRCNSIVFRFRSSLLT